MTELERAFAIKVTENGDKSYNTTGHAALDILFMSQYFRNNIKDLPNINNYERKETFARFMRDPRHGLGEKNVGLALLNKNNATPEEIVAVGSFKDLLKDGYKKENIDYIFNEAKNGNELAKKYMPRLSSGKESRLMAKAIIKDYGLTEKEYRSLIKLDSTVEYKLSHNDDIDYSKVPSIASLKYINAFYNHNEEAYSEYRNNLASGNTTMNNSVTTCYDLYKVYQKNKKDTMLDTMFKNLPQLSVGSILPIIDNSGSMYDTTNSEGKAKAIGHYVSKKSTYMNNHIITFSDNPKLLKLGETYSEDMDVLTSYHDIGYTNFGAVMSILEKLETDFPDYLLVLSDMEFDVGSSDTKDSAMEIMKDKGAQTKIIWWNFNTRNKTVPETDNYGNLYLSGYSPQMLSFLENNFDGAAFLNKMLDEYEKKTKDIL